LPPFNRDRRRPEGPRINNRIRVSPSVYNSPADIDRLIGVLTTA
jgi:selenocysteine lyase/cysteine desulfurase